MFFRKVTGKLRLPLQRSAGRLVNLFDVYPDQKWLLIGMSLDGEVIFPARGAPFVTYAHLPMWLRWTGGKYVL